MGNLLHAGWTMAYYAYLEKKIAALTAAQVSEAFRKHIDSTRLVIISAGDFATDAVGGQEARTTGRGQQCSGAHAVVC